MGKLGGTKWPDEENGKLDPWWRNGTFLGPFDDAMGKLETLAMMKLRSTDYLMGKFGTLDH